jgi:hypothetical protein
MTSEEIIRYVMSLIGVGTVVAVLNWAKEAISAKRQTEIARLQEQLKSLYAPLHYFTTQNQQLAQLWDNVMQAYKAEYGGRNWSEESFAAGAAKRATAMKTKRLPPLDQWISG